MGHWCALHRFDQHIDPASELLATDISGHYDLCTWVSCYFIVVSLLQTCSPFCVTSRGHLARFDTTPWLGYSSLMIAARLVLISISPDV